ncbi:MAG: tRNA (N6-isopentenyl adenosine(37)-C2)-methylthiotransferase MiaB [Sphaerochaetaceae bacterium]|nr:tRNA (N6-isopentenyl adenosine(37)-C2)-methylthiotransferase MiaB [Sphaerochaetaceae bacterium]
MKFLLESYGCQMNMAESVALENELIHSGIEKTENAEEADAVIINTCSVRKSAEDRIWGRLSYYGHLKKSRKLKLVVTGCMAERLQEDLKSSAPYVDAVIGTNEKLSIISYITDDRLDKAEKYTFEKSYYNEGDYSSYVPIMNGCNNFCTYCIVPYVRGREISRSVDEVLDEVRFLDRKGVKEITLLGQNVNSYNYDGVNFPGLLKLILKELNNIQWIRFESPHPKDFSDELIDLIATEERIASHIHLPMQSGSSRILKLMNRKADREAFIYLVEKMRKAIPDLSFATDVMVGFPTETEEEYEETLSMMEIMHPLEAFMYFYNLREGTPAAKMDGQIDEKTKGRRLQNLIDIQMERLFKEKETRVGQVCKVLVTGNTRDDKSKFLGRNEHNEMFSFASTCPLTAGKMVTVKAVGLKGNTYLGEMIDG